MTRSEFEKAAAERNRKAAEARAHARNHRTPCDLETMFAFGGATYCRAHGVMGPCPYGPPPASSADRARSAQAAEARAESRAVAMRWTRISRCADCGEEGVLTGHQECQYPGRFSDPDARN